MSENGLIIDNSVSKEILGHRVTISVDQHFAYFDKPLVTEEADNLSLLFHEMRTMGVDKLRIDWKIEDVMPEQGQIDHGKLERLQKITEIAHESGLKSAIVLAHTPEWAVKLAKKNPEAFIKAYQDYVDVVFNALTPEGKPSMTPSNIQAFNELNMQSYTPNVLLQHIPMCANILREKSQQYFGKKISIMATLAVHASPVKSVPKFMYRSLEFIQENQDVLSNFDEIGLDYYPGIWHLPKKTIDLYWKNRKYFIQAFQARNNPTKVELLRQNAPIDMFKQAFGNMDLLEETLEALQPLKKKLSIAEIGAPMIIPLETPAIRKENEKLQALAVLIMAMKLRPLLKKYTIEEVGLYCITNKPKSEALGFYEWGWVQNDGERNYMLSGKTGLKSIIRLLNYSYDPLMFEPVTGNWVERYPQSSFK